MTYTEDDAWEQWLDEWPREHWIFPRLELWGEVNYLGNSVCPPMQSRLRDAFGRTAGNERLLAALSEAESVVANAVDLSQTQGHESWLKHEVWVPALDESIRAGVEPARMFIECLALVGSDFSGQELCAAVGLWCYGEYTRAHSKVSTSLAQNSVPSQYSNAVQLLQEAALALAEAEWYRGNAEGNAEQLDRIAKRNKASADKGHARNRERRLKGIALWQSKSWNVQADAERAIAAEYHVQPEVAGRWIREFKHSQK